MLPNLAFLLLDQIVAKARCGRQVNGSPGHGQGTPEALPYPILRRLSSTSQRRAGACKCRERGGGHRRERAAPMGKRRSSASAVACSAARYRAIRYTVATTIFATSARWFMSSTSTVSVVL